MVHIKKVRWPSWRRCCCPGSAFAEQRALEHGTPTTIRSRWRHAEAMIADFEAANPEIDVVLTNFDHEGYKNAIRNFLTADAPDLANWYAGNRMRPSSKAGQFMDISDVWAEERAERLAGLGGGCR